MSREIEQIRRTVITRRQARERQAEAHAALNQHLLHASQADRPSIQADLNRSTARLRNLRRREEAALEKFRDVLNSNLPEDLTKELDGLRGDCSIVLFPVRLETRFQLDAGRGELLVRVYPDEIFADAHQPLLTVEECRRGTSFWRMVWKDPDNAQAWQELASSMPPPRAAWVTRSTRPVNFDRRRDEAPIFPPLDLADQPWTRAVRTYALPDRWILIAYRDGREVVRSAGAPIDPALALSMSPDAAADFSLAPGLSVDADCAWLFSFEAAVRCGMGMRVAISAEDAERGFDRLIVTGVRRFARDGYATEQLQSLFDNHQYTGGLSLIPQGSPTNNTEGESSAWSRSAIPPAPNEARGRSAVPCPDGARLSTALGIPQAVFSSTEQPLHDHELAAAIADALWPATLGYFASVLMQPVFSAQEIAEARDYFVAHVHGNGPLPAMRVGATPYGVLPVSSLKAWKSDSSVRPGSLQASLPKFLYAAREVWRAAVPRVARMRVPSPDADDDLLRVLGIEASSREVWARDAVGPDFVANLLAFMGLPNEWTRWLAEQSTYVGGALRMFGRDNWEPLLNKVNFNDQSKLVSGPLVTSPDDAGFDWIRWLGECSSGEAWHEDFPEGGEHPGCLLYVLLRYALLREYARAATSLTAGAVRERTFDEFADFNFDVLNIRVDGRTAGEILDRSPTEEIVRLRNAIRKLAGLDSSQLERLFSEHLDICSWRLDAWITSLAAERLMTRDTSAGCHLGAYGWVEDLRPRRASIGPGGCIAAPSMTHAAAAAVLRSAHLARRTPASDPYAVNLSSTRVRAAGGVLDAVRDGHPLGAVLGQNIERLIADRLSPERSIAIIETARRLYPLTSGEPEDAAIFSSRNADGLKFMAAWLQGVVPFGSGGFDEGGDSRAVLHEAGEAALVSIKGIAELLLAESVFQAIGSNTSAAGASLDSLAQGVRPPEPEIARQVRGGIAVSHRVVILFPERTESNLPGWSAIPATPRAVAAPELDHWVSTLIGDPRSISCTVTRSSAGRRIVTLDETGLRAIDLLVAAGRGRPAFDEYMADRVARERHETLALHEAGPGHSSIADTAAFLVVFHRFVSVCRACKQQDLARDVTDEPADGPERFGPVLARAQAVAAALGGNDATRRAEALHEAALFGVMGAPDAADDSRRVRSIHDDMNARIRRANAAVTGSEVSLALFGENFLHLKPLDVPPSVAEGLANTASIGATHAEISKWFSGAARIREHLQTLQSFGWASRARGKPLAWGISQSPVNARWVALSFAAGEAPPVPGTISLAIHAPFGILDRGHCRGLFVDEWPEVIPSRDADSAVAFHFDSPANKAPQAVLIAVPPHVASSWTLTNLLQTLDETMELAKLRLVDSELLDPLSSLIPALYSPYNLAPESLAADIGSLTSYPVIVTEAGS